jgi:hypothetical protein
MNERSFIVKSHLARVEVVFGSAQFCLSKVERAASPPQDGFAPLSSAASDALSLKIPHPDAIPQRVVRHDGRGLRPQCQAINRKAA